MFKTLTIPQSQTVPETPPVPVVVVDTIARKQKVTEQMTMRLAMLQQARAQLQLTNELHRMDNLRGDYADMRHFRRVVRQQGLSRALMSFVNPHNQLTAIIPGMPANESLDAVTVKATDPRAVAALEGVDATLDQHPALVADWIQTGSDNLEVLLESLKPQTADLGEAISHYLEELEGAEIDDDDLAGCTAVLLPHDDILDRICSLLEMFPDLDAEVSDPTDQDAMAEHAKTVAERADKLGDHAGLGVDDGNPHQQTLDRGKVTPPQHGTLAELGYDLPKTVELLKKADALLDEVEGLIARKEAMVGQLASAKTMVSDLDNDVPPGVEGAIPADDDSADADGGNTTQCDMVHCQVSSHLCCIGSAVECAIDAVQAVLTAAQMMDQLDDDETPNEPAPDTADPNEPAA